MKTLQTTRAIVTAGLVMGLWLGGSTPSRAQPPAAPAGPTIQHVTLHEGTGVLTITGTGFGREPVVTIDGYGWRCCRAGARRRWQWRCRRCCCWYRGRIG